MIKETLLAKVLWPFLLDLHKCDVGDRRRKKGPGREGVPDVEVPRHVRGWDDHHEPLACCVIVGRRTRGLPLERRRLPFGGDFKF